MVRLKYRKITGIKDELVPAKFYHPMKTTWLSGLILSAAILVYLKASADPATNPPVKPTVSQSFRAAGTNISDAAVQIGTEIKDGAVHAAMEVKTGAVWVAGQVKTGAVNVATEVKERSGSAWDRTTHTPQEIIDQAKGQVADARYRDAMETLDRLEHFKLTDEQQKSVDALRAQIQKAFANGK